MYLSLIPWESEANASFGYIFADHLILTLGSEMIAHHSGLSIPANLLIPFDRHRNAWLGPIPLRELDGQSGAHSLRLLDFVGPLSFRLRAFVRRSDERSRLEVLTCTISDDLRRVTIVHREPLLVDVTGARIWHDLYYKDGQCSIATARFRTNLFLYEVDGLRATEKCVLPDVVHSGYANGKVFFIGPHTECRSKHGLFSYDVDAGDTRQVPNMIWDRSFAFAMSANGKLFVFARSTDDENAQCQDVSVYDLASSDTGGASFYSLRLPASGARRIVVVPLSNGNALVHTVGAAANGATKKDVLLCTTPPRLYELALCAVHQHLSGDARERIGNADGPLISFTRFVQLLQK